MKNMKAIDFSCASQTTTAICSSINQRSMIKNTTKPLNKLNSYLTNTISNTSSSSSSSSSYSKTPCISDELPLNPTLSDVIPRRRRSSADVMDIQRYIHKHKTSNQHSTTTYLLGETSTKRNDIFSTPVFGSSEGRRSTSRIETRGCLGWVRDGDEKDKIRKHFSGMDVGDESKINKQRNNDNAWDTYCNGVSQKQLSMGHSGNHSFLQKHPPHQVVVLRVSLHCKGCEGKLRKHLSKIEGVTSFSIDMESKKVTVIGNLTPLALLTSISKVKNAQLWPSETTN